MRIILNNRDEYFKEEEMTFEELLEQKKFTFRMLVTKLNGKLVKKELRDSTIIRDGDDVTVLHLVSGGQGNIIIKQIGHVERKTIFTINMSNKNLNIKE